MGILDKMMPVKASAGTPSLSDEQLAEQRQVLESEKLYQKGLTTVKDIIAPSVFEINSGHVRLNNKLAITLFVYAYPRYLQTNWFSPVVNLDGAFDIAMFIHPQNTADVLKQLKKAVTRPPSTASTCPAAKR
jgi:hypothetical protein